MRRLAWTVGWVGVGIWSLLCAAAYGIFDLVGRFSMRNADAFSSDPDFVEGLWRLLNFLHGLSTTAVAVTWAIVSLLILSVPWLLDRMISGSGNPRDPAARVGRTRRPGDENVIDLAPDQYSVGPAGAPRPPSGPLVPRR